MPKKFRHSLITILLVCLFLGSCGPNGGQSKTAQNQIDNALAQQIAGSFVAAAKHNIGLIAWQMLPSSLQDGANREPNPHVQAVNCDGVHVLAYVVAGHEGNLQLTNLSSLKALRITSAVRQLWPHSFVGLSTSEGNMIGATNGMTACAGQLAAATNLGHGPVIVVPLSAVTDTLEGFDPTRDVYSYTPINANTPCQQKLQVCHLDSTSKELVCHDATEPQQGMPLTKDNCVTATSPVSVADNTDITLWEQAVQRGIITTADAYTISGGVVTKLTTAMAEKLDCPDNADGTGIVENPQVTRTSGWQLDSDGNKAPVSNPGSIVACQGGWQGTLFAKYERRSCNLKKITSTGTGVATMQTKPQTVFQLYYVGAKCQTATPVVNTATCSASVPDSNGVGSFSIARHFAMSQPVALTWTNTKNTSTSKLASDDAPPPQDLGYTQLHQTVSDGGRGFSANLGNALQEVSVLNKSTVCSVGNACDLSTPNPPVTTYNFECPAGWTGPTNGKCSFTSINPGECPPNSTTVTVGGVDKCELAKICIGGNPANGCKGQCPDGSDGPTCPPNKVCKSGDHGDGTTCTRDAVCPSTLQPPNADGSCPGSAGSGGGPGTIACPTGTDPITVGGVITGCEKAVDCEEVPTPAKFVGSMNVFAEAGMNISGTYSTFKCSGGEGTHNVCYNLLNPTAQKRFCYSIGNNGQKKQGSCEPDGPRTVSGSIPSVVAQLRDGANNIPSGEHSQGIFIQSAQFSPSAAASLDESLSQPAAWTIMYAQNFVSDDTYYKSRCQPANEGDRDGCYVINTKKYCTLYDVPRVANNTGCYRASLSQDLGYQKGGGAEVRLYSSGAAASTSTPVISRGGLDSAAQFTNLLEGFSRSIR